MKVSQKKNHAVISE